MPLAGTYRKWYVSESEQEPNMARETLSLAGLALASEVAADRLDRRATGMQTVTFSADEVETIAARMRQLAAVARVHHAHLLRTGAA